MRQISATFAPKKPYLYVLDMNNTTKSYSITLTWKAFGLEYLKAILMIPLLGYGLYRLWKMYQHQQNTTFEITDNDVRAYSADGKTILNLADISEVTVLQAGLDKRLGVARLFLSSGDNEILIPGLENADQLENVLHAAILQEKKRREHHRELEQKKPRHAPGSLEKMNDLTGLWQQGLITDEEFEQERKKFE